MMLYISFALILFGILLFVYSILSDSGLVKNGENDLTETTFSKAAMRNVAVDDLHDMNNYHDKSSFKTQENDYDPELRHHNESRNEIKKYQGEDYPDMNFDDDFDNNSYNDSNNDLLHDSDLKDGFPDDEQNFEDYENAAYDEKEQGRSNIDTGGIILFDDRSNIIDYFDGTGRIDSSLEQYGSIKRIGEGKLALERDGINFYMEKKIFRFDFHRINNLYTGENFLAVQLKGSEAVKLFVIKDWTETMELIKDKFKEYKESTVS